MYRAEQSSAVDPEPYEKEAELQYNDGPDLELVTTSSPDDSEPDTRKQRAEPRFDPETETHFSLVGLRFVDDSQGERRLYYGADRITLGKSSMRVFEVVSLYPEGLEFGRLHRKIKTLTGGKASEQSLRAHLQAIDGAFAEAELPYWKQSIREGRHGGRREHYQVEGVVPRHPSTWPEYFAALRPPMDGFESQYDTEAWIQYTACRDLDKEIFYPEESAAGLWVGRLACSMCTVREDCLEWGSQFEKNKPSVQHVHGLLAGMTHTQRFKAYRKAETEGRWAAEKFIRETQVASDKLARDSLWARLRPNVDRSRKPPFTMDDIAVLADKARPRPQRFL